MSGIVGGLEWSGMGDLGEVQWEGVLFYVRGFRVSTRGKLVSGASAGPARSGSVEAMDGQMYIIILRSIGSIGNIDGG